MKNVDDDFFVFFKEILEEKYPEIDQDRINIVLNEVQRKKNRLILDNATHIFLEHLSEEDIKDIQEAIKLVKAIKTTSGVLKWIIFVAISGIIASISIGDQIAKIFKFIFGSN